MSTWSWIRQLPFLWFSFRMPVSRAAYAVTGLALMSLKFAIDHSIYYAATGEAWRFSNYLHPLLSGRFGDERPELWVIWTLGIVMLPFLWIGVSMTARRCVDARLSIALSFLFFVPAVNYLLMIVLCVAPSRATEPIDPWTQDRLRLRPVDPRRRLFASIGAGAAVGLVMVLISVLFLESYGFTVFIGVPFVMGAVAVFIYSDGSMRAGALFGITQLALLTAALALVLFALEGIICLAMAYPIAMVLALFGGLLGEAMARVKRPTAAPLTGLLLGLPLLLGLDVVLEGPPLREVVSAIEIDAPPEIVWANVIGFSDIPRPDRLVFDLGVAYPTGARIEGRGVNAMRYCEFSTGAFVEPITAWEPPLRLAFDVTAQPQPMQEWSPYTEVHAPHLVGGLVSKRGEFRLVRLPDGRTRLEGRTWYSLDMAPQGYWTIWSDWIIHQIHEHVLDHVRSLSEETVVARAPTP